MIRMEYSLSLTLEKRRERFAKLDPETKKHVRTGIIFLGHTGR
jgi:hypothetical protein